MVAAGIEVVVGARIDPLLGPLIVAGFGGVLVELLRDSALELAPINAAEATRMLRSSKAQRYSTDFAAGRPSTWIGSRTSSCGFPSLQPTSRA